MQQYPGMYHICRVIIYISLLFFAIPANGSGLQFSRKVPQTRLDLFDGGTVSFNNSVTISFELSILNTESFGQILVYDAADSPYSFAYIGRDKDNSTFVFSNLADKKQFSEIPLSTQDLGPDRWLDIRISFNLIDKTAGIEINDKCYSLGNITVSNPSRAGIIFGANQMSIPEVPEMIVRNIQISDNSSLAKRFLLSESSGTTVHDIDGTPCGSVINPIWRINNHYHWEKTGTFAGSAAAGIVIDNKDGKILIVNDSILDAIDLDTFDCSAVHVDMVRKYPGYSGEAIYNQVDNEVYFYNLADVGEFTKPFFSVISLDDNTGDTCFPVFSNPLHHHAYVFDDESRQLFIFGGYGNYSYSGRIYRYNPGECAWDELSVSGELPCPRMHTVAGSAGDDGRFYVFGGVGNEIGKQELGREFFCDLYLIDTNTLTSRKLWSRPFSGDDFIPTRGLIYDEESHCIYVLCYGHNTGYISLHRINVETAGHDIVSDNIPYQTNCILSAAYLFYNKNTGYFYAVTRLSRDNDPESTIEVYRLSDPPITLGELHHWNSIDKRTPWLYCLYVVIGLIVIAFGCWLYMRARSGKAPFGSKHITESDGAETDRNVNCVTAEPPGVLPVRHTPVKCNAVYLFDDFQVFDSKGTEISYQFGSKIRQMFVMVLLHMHQSRGGITTAKLSSCMWPEKTVSAAKNIRSVTVNHLRGILKDIDGVEFLFENDRWIIRHDDRFYCDYLEALMLAGEIMQENTVREETVTRFVEILQRGTLLPSFTRYEWFENIRIEHDEFFIKVIETILREVPDTYEPRRILILANLLSSLDLMSEIAIYHKVTALCRLGQKVHAQNVYRRFQEEYYRLYGKKYSNPVLE